MRWLRRLLLLALIIGAMVGGWQFASENQDPVSVHYVAGELPPFPLWQVILVAFGSGGAIVALYAMFTSARSGLVRRKYRKEIGGLEAEIHQLRNLPLAPESDSPGRSASAGPLSTGGASGGNG